MQVFTLQQFLIMPKKYDSLVLDVCSCLKYKSIFDTIHLKETGKSFPSLFQFCIIVGNAIATFYSSVIFDNVENIQ